MDPVEHQYPKERYRDVTTMSACALENKLTWTNLLLQIQIFFGMVFTLMYTYLAFSPTVIARENFIYWMIYSAFMLGLAAAITYGLKGRRSAAWYGALINSILLLITIISQDFLIGLPFVALVGLSLYELIDQKVRKQMIIGLYDQGDQNRGNS